MLSILHTLRKRFSEDYGIDPGDVRAPGISEFNGLHGSARALLTASLYAGGTIIVVTRNNRDAGDFCSDLGLFMKPEDIFLFPAQETLPYDDSPPFTEITEKRIIALTGLLGGRSGVYVLPVRSFTGYYPTRGTLKESMIDVECSMVLSLDAVVRKLTRIGFSREDRVSERGMFALRGDILDIYSFGWTNPCRIELFDDTVESIRTFSAGTQRSLSEIERCTVLPAREGLPEEGVRERVKTEMISHYAAHDAPLHAGDDCYLLVDSLQQCRRTYEFFRSESHRIYEEKKGEHILPVPGDLMADFDGLLDSFGRYGVVSLLPETNGRKYGFSTKERVGYSGRIEQFKKDVGRMLDEGYTVVVGAGYEGQTERLRELLPDLLQRYENLYIHTLNLSEGFTDENMKFAVILDREIFNRKKRYGAASLEARSQPVDTLRTITKGDYIVHVEHGIGVYRGIEKLTSGGAEKDFIKIEYRDGDEVFIPVDQINLLQKYIGQEGRRPRIDRIGSSTWKKVKSHVKKSVKTMAAELLELYASRASLRGHGFSSDSQWQYEFESGFRYEETPDQLRTIEEVKGDMEDPHPMDRLICGDVGFGKTEVAVRAAFKAVMDGKQVAVLVPTTILAEQHLNTFGERFSLYPVTVEMLSRFKTPAQQRTIIRNLNEGLIDVIIGTHRLIQKDIFFKDLGLVIIDEEQRFGVEHKEKLKQLRKLVDVITMTATPIPRTLYMSMTNIRDMSLIETPPAERVPIETYVMEYNPEIVVHAIQREVERGGQVYYVHNRVKTIDRKVEELRNVLPGVTVERAHGQMEERELEEIMQDFFEMEFQVLVTTTIIESGLDIPNVNTIIIERADRFGLSQLYQLRGRVGRGKRKAYAYLLYPEGRIISEQAQKRLTVINDHTALGSGFAIALKDLELRGAGNVLGRQQHGEILTVGFEMYVKLLDEAVRELRGTEEAAELEVTLDLKYKGYIPQSYIEGESGRIEMYKRLNGVHGDEELADLREEMSDRFGKLPSELEELFENVKLKILCSRVGIRGLRERENELHVTFEKSRVDILTLIRKIEENRSIFGFSPHDPNILHVYRVFGDTREKYVFFKELFEYDDV